MTTQFASGKYAHGFCDRCGFRVDKLNSMRKLVINEQVTNIKVCATCWEADHPQLKIGRVQINDPQALREPRPDPSLQASRE